MVIRDGRIVMVGECNERAASHHDAAEIIDHRPTSDPAGLHRCPYPFPADAGDRRLCRGAARMAQRVHLRRGAALRATRRMPTRIASRFFDELIRHGTTTAAAYCSVHPQSVDAYLRRSGQARHAGGRRQGDDGPQRAAGPAATRAQSGYDDTKAGIAKWHGKGRAHYAITPRFAITSTHEQMAMAEALAKEFPDLHIQTHVSENLAEIAYANELFLKLWRLCRHLREVPSAGAEDPAGPLHPPRAIARPRCWRRRARWRCSARPRTCSSARACSTMSASTSAAVRIATATDVGRG